MIDTVARDQEDRCAGVCTVVVVVVDTVVVVRTRVSHVRELKVDRGGGIIDKSMRV